MGHRGTRSEEAEEFRAARTFCLRNSKYDDEEDEKIFIGTPAEVATFVKVMVDNAYMADVPDTPRGLILTDNRFRGAFQ